MISFYKSSQQLDSTHVPSPTQVLQVGSLGETTDLMHCSLIESKLHLRKHHKMNDLQFSIKSGRLPSLNR